MARPVIATKLYVPRLRPGLVTRPRLRERLSRATGSRLTLVSAPAGFGKTTLLAEWLHEAAGHDQPVCWLSLDPEDGDPASFWTGVITALRTALPSKGLPALDAIAAAVPMQQLLTLLLNELAAVPADVWLVLDDYHVVDGHDVSEGMAFFLDHLPPQVHVMLSTRADPGLPLPRWRVRGELTEIRVADLRFTSEEAAAYLNEVAGLDLAPHDVAALEERTEGWIAALQLAALSIRGRDDVRGFIARFAGDDRYIVDYLVEEVLRHQPDPVRDFLLQTAILDRLTGALCDAVTGRSDGRDMLTTLERANLFVVPLDDRREWYRYHHLFADVLRARMLADQPDLVPLLHQRASRWYERHDHAGEAVKHALAGQDVDRAAHLMELAVPSIRRNRQDAMLIGWVKDLPDDAVRRSPVLSVFKAYMSLATGDLGGVEPRLDDAERALAAVPAGTAAPWADTEELHTLPATIAVYRASLAQARGDAAGTAQHAQHALDLAGPTDHLARGSAAGFLGLAAWANGDIASALDTFAQAVASLHAAGNLVDELGSTVVLGDMWLTAGRPSKARRLYENALELAGVQGEPVARAAAELHTGLSEIDREAGDFVAARHHLELAAALNEGAPVTESRYRWFLAMGRVADAEGDPENALALLDQAKQLYRPGFFPEVRPIAAIRARVQIAQGNLADAVDWAREAGVSTEDDVSYLREFDHLTLVRLLIAQYRRLPGTPTLDAASALLSRLLDAAQTSGRAGSVLEIRMVQSLVHDAQGRRRQAVQCLAAALEQAPEPQGYLRLFLDEGTRMTQLLREASPGRVKQPGPSRADSLSERELQVLSLLDSELTGPQIARQLFVSQNTLRTHTKHIFTKLDVTSRRAAVHRARELGLM